MVLLVAIVLNRLRSLRFAAVRRQEVPIGYYRSYQGDEPEALQVVARHFSNLFEVPVLFYVGVLMIYVTQQVSYWAVALAWLYVALRYAHSYVHLTSNDVQVRFGVYLASGFVLLLLWASLLFQLLRSG
jgi:hypothetical protein